MTTLRLGDGFSVAQPAGPTLRERVDARPPVARRIAGCSVSVPPPRTWRRMRQAVGLPDRQGVLVRAVESDSPGRAGLRQGDLITAVAGIEIADTDGLSAAPTLPDGQTLSLHVVRGTDEIEVVVHFDDDGGAAGATDVGDA